VRRLQTRVLAKEEIAIVEGKDGSTVCMGSQATCLVEFLTQLSKSWRHNNNKMRALNALQYSSVAFHDLAKLQDAILKPAGNLWEPLGTVSPNFSVWGARTIRFAREMISPERAGIVNIISMMSLRQVLI
jgi:hypothetical protein